MSTTETPVGVIDPDTGEVHDLGAVEDTKQTTASLQLPMFEGYRFPTAKVKFTGGFPLALHLVDDRALYEAMSMNKSVTITLEVGGHQTVLDASVAKKTHAVDEQGEITVLLKVDDSAGAEA